MPGKRSASSLAARQNNGVLKNVRKRELMVEMREENVKKREAEAPELNAQAMRLAMEAATTAKQATQLAAAHLVNDVDEHVRELVHAASIGMRWFF